MSLKKVGAALFVSGFLVWLGAPFLLVGESDAGTRDLLAKVKDAGVVAYATGVLLYLIGRRRERIPRVTPPPPERWKR